MLGNIYVNIYQILSSSLSVNVAVCPSGNYGLGLCECNLSEGHVYVLFNDYL